MRVIISTVHKKMALYKVYKSFIEITNEEWAKIDCLVYHSSTDSTMDVIFSLNNLADNVKQRIYINAVLDPLVYRTFTSINGFVYTDEQFLDDAESLDYLIENVGTLGCEVNDTVENLDKLSTCINAVIDADEETRLKLIKNKNWVQTLNGCMEHMNYSLQIAVQSNDHMRSFLRTVDTYITDLHKKQQKAVSDVEKLRANLEIITQNQGTLKAFGVYKPTVLTKPILYIRCIGDIPYLITLLLCFQQFVKTTKQKKSKLLLIRTQQFNYITRYSEFYRLDNNSAKFYDPINNPRSEFVTYEPVKNVMETFFKLDADFFIVIDYLQNNKPIIESSANVINCLAYSSIGYYENQTINTKRVPANQTFFAQKGITGANIIPYIAEIQHDMTIQQKNKLLFTHAKGIMETLVQILGI